MVVGHQEMKKEEREELIRDKADKKRKKTLARGLKPMTPSTEMRVQSLSSNPGGIRSRAGSARSSRANTPPPTASPRLTSPFPLERRRSRTFTEGLTGGQNQSNGGKGVNDLIPPTTQEEGVV